MDHLRITAMAVLEALTIERERSAKLVENLINERPFKNNYDVRVALAIAAGVVRRGRNWTEQEKMLNLANAMDAADLDNGTAENAKMAKQIRKKAAQTK